MFRRLALMGLIVLCTVTDTSCVKGRRGHRRGPKNNQRRRTPSPQPVVPRRQTVKNPIVVKPKILRRIPTDLEKEQTMKAQHASFNIYLELAREEAEKQPPKKAIRTWRHAIKMGRRLHAANIDKKYLDAQVAEKTSLLPWLPLISDKNRYYPKFSREELLEI